MDRNLIFRLNGEYFGFITDNYFFDAEGDYIGWVEEDDSVWQWDGSYLGRLFEDSYVLYNPEEIEQPVRMPKPPPMPPSPPMTPPFRMPRKPPMSREDALQQFIEDDEPEHSAN